MKKGVIVMLYNKFVRGAKSRIELDKGYCKYGKYYCKIELNIINPPKELIIETLKNLYHDYEYSKPDKSRRKRVFKAKDFDELSTEQLIEAGKREECYLKLVAFFYYVTRKGLLRFEDLDNDPRHWYWVSKENKNFAIMKKWFGETESKGE